MPKQVAERVLLVGWDAADWDVIEQMRGRGLMPNLSAMLDRGARGRVATLEPMLSPMLWNSVATGKTADGHGILGFVEPKPEGEGIRPVSSLSRKSKALWNILNQNGKRSLVFNWFASHPAEPIDGVCVSNRFQHPTGTVDEPWPLPEGTVHPPELAGVLAEQRVHPGELGPDAVMPFLREWDRVRPAEDKPFKELVGMLAQCLSVHAASTWAMEHRDWDFCAIYHDAIDHFGHVFMPYFPPKLERVDQREYDCFHAVMAGVYQFHDMMLGRLLELAGDETLIVLLSDHGFHHDRLRPGPEAGPVAWHKPFGVLAMAGPGVRVGGEVYGASLLDIAPTVLAAMGIAPGEDMPGRVLTRAFDDLDDPPRGPGWEDLPGDAGTHPPRAREDPLAEAEVIERLAALGYVDAPGSDTRKAVERVRLEMRKNLAESHQALGRFAEAAEIFARLLGEHPES